MAENNSGPIEAVRGIVSGAIGFTKQVIGLILSNSNLQEEGKPKSTRPRISLRQPARRPRPRRLAPRPRRRKRARRLLAAPSK